ncbi:hypothetical protein [Roseiterribacter gracilis]|uniref:Uncharacterized protein n=1 Tax=Roseiterribacter gracilis TaxID=2812848 RepID=A0A8S8X7P7_9PROT|nr:hypothetical protein TMPK1_00590 [Rhodospirillales bacterium TMPK1]
MRRAAWLILAAPLLLAAAPAKTWPGNIERWLDKYPSEKIGGSDLLAQRGFAQGVTKLVGADSLRKMRTIWMTQSPVTRDGDLFLVQACRTHSCTVANYAVVIDKIHGVVAVCLAYNDGSGLAKTWSGPDGRKPRTTHESDMQYGCSGEPKRLFDEAKAFALQTPG